MTKNKRTDTLLEDKTAINIIEKKAGKSILKIPKHELLERLRSLSDYEFHGEGLECDSWSLKLRFIKLISEGKLPDFVAKIKKPSKPSKPLKPLKPSKYKLTINPKNRTGYEIQFIILTQSESGLKQTQIMYRSNLSYPQLLKYLDNLSRLGLLVKEGDIYKTTDLGRDFNYAFQQLRKFLSDESTDEPVKLDEESKELAILSTHQIKRKKVYDHSALILEKASEPTNKYNLMMASTKSSKTINAYIEFLIGLNLLRRVDADKFETTPLGSQYLEAYLNFILFNYLG